MPIIRLERFTPNVYANNSRDFQLLCRTYDSIVNGVKFDIDTIPTLSSTKMCRESLLELLQTKLGFFTTKPIDNETLRYVLSAFPYLIKSKGTREAILQAIYVFLKIERIDYNSSTSVVIDNTNYEILINFESTKKLDYSILHEIFRYILPTGYIVKISQGTTYSIPNDVGAKLKDSLYMFIPISSIGPLVKSTKDTYDNLIEDELDTENWKLLGLVGMTAIYKYASED